MRIPKRNKIQMKKEALKLVLDHEVKKVSKMRYSVGKYFVWFKLKLGRTEIYCDCYNGAKFCNSPVICKHKIAVIHFIQMQEFYSYLKEIKRASSPLSGPELKEIYEK